MHGPGPPLPIGEGMALSIRSTALALCLGLAGLLALAPAARGQVRTERHPRLGLTVERSLAYERLPVPPREQRLALLYVVEERGTSPVPATIAVYVLTPEDPDATDTRSFVEQLVRPDHFEERSNQGTRNDHRGVAFDTTETREDGTRVVGRVHGWESEDRCVVVHAYAEAAVAERELQRWKRFASTMTLDEPEAWSRRAYEARRHYAARSFPDVDRRIAARLASPEGWDARDTRHYLVLLHGQDRALQVRMGDELEALRKTFARELPRSGSPDATGVVRLCEDRSEYLAYGGDPRAVGYFSPQEGELVLYLAGDEEELLRTLRHEAFHQYVFHALGGVSPHPWFDEGLAEVYGGARIEQGRVEGFTEFRDLTYLTRQALRHGTAASLEAFLRMDQAGYYAEAQVHYPQGWSLVTYLREHAPNRRGELLERYFEGLHRAWGRELEGLGTSLDPAAWQAAVERAREAALVQALRGVDVARLERDWSAWASSR